MQNKCFLSRINQLFSQVLINAVTGQVATSTDLSAYGVYQAPRTRICRNPRSSCYC